MHLCLLKAGLPVAQYLLALARPQALLLDNMCCKAVNAAASHHRPQGQHVHEVPSCVWGSCTGHGQECVQKHSEGLQSNSELCQAANTPDWADPKLSSCAAAKQGLALFQLVACNTEPAVQAMGEKLCRSKRKADQRMASHLLDVTVPGIAAAAAEEERQARAAERLRTQLGSLGAAGAFGRCAEASEASELMGNTRDSSSGGHELHVVVLSQ